MSSPTATLLTEIRACDVCRLALPNPPRPILQLGGRSRLLIIGQAPGRRAHESGIPWNDASGVRLRGWLGLSDSEFYDPTRVSIVPMGFCYPGSSTTGDLPPRAECAPLWHSRIIAELGNVGLTLLIGRYAQLCYLPGKATGTLTATVARFEEFLPTQLPLPHPSPRNQLWFKRNPWFETRVIPELQAQVAGLWSTGYHPPR